MAKENPNIAPGSTPAKRLIAKAAGISAIAAIPKAKAPTSIGPPTPATTLNASARPIIVAPNVIIESGLTPSNKLNAYAAGISATATIAIASAALIIELAFIFPSDLKKLVIPPPPLGVFTLLTALDTFPVSSAAFPNIFPSIPPLPFGIKLPSVCLNPARAGNTPIRSPGNCVNAAGIAAAAIAVASDWSSNAD